MLRNRALSRLIIMLAVMIIAGLWFMPVEAAPAPQETTQVYALPGQLRRAVDQPFDTYLVANDGAIYGLTGETPQVEDQIVAYRESGPGAEVKVWGTLYPDGRSTDVAEIVVKSIQPSDPAGTPPTPTPGSSSPTATVRYESVNVRAGPGLGYPTIGAKSLNESCTIIGRDASSAWWQIQCPDGAIGWISNDVVNVSGDVSNVRVIAAPPPPPPPPTPAPPPPSSGAWTANYFANRDLAGAPVLTQNVNDIAFNWSTGSPGPSVPPDNFSARYERNMSFSTGTYEFRSTYDDGVRIFLDGQLILDDWNEGTPRSSSVQRLLSGSHNIVVEYFEATGTAAVVVVIGLVRESADWNASYYNNTDLTGNAVLVRGEPRGQAYPLDYNWGDGSPAPDVVNADYFSGRWVGSFYFDAGDYTFQINVDDGARLFLDGIRVIDAWSDGYKEVSNVFNGVGDGSHQVTVEYYERTGGAAVRAWWWLGGGPQPPPPSGGRPRDE